MKEFKKTLMKGFKEILPYLLYYLFLLFICLIYLMISAV